jgi:hypothetical protein
VLDTRVYKGNQRATEGDMEKIVFIAKTEDLRRLEEIEDVAEVAGM